jgi:catechol 2,3-dioxygenase-like lactoylglutathione lyase family enzyme
MLSHVHIGVTDFPRAFAFYSALMETLGYPLRFQEPKKSWAGWKPVDAARPLFLIGLPFNGETAAPGNGQMTALLAASRTAVDKAHAAALAHGGTCDGPPGLRPQYHEHYYGAYFRDPDGNKICVACHAPEGAKP